MDSETQGKDCQVCGGDITTAAEGNIPRLLQSLGRERMERVVKVYGQEILVACASCFIPLGKVANGA